MEKVESLILIATLVAVISSAFIGYTLVPGKVKSIEFNAPAVTLDGSGTLGSFKMTLIPGTGKTLVNIENAAFYSDVENSFRKAKLNAEGILGVKLAYYDLILEAKRVNVVSGESAGAVLTAAIVALATDHTFDASATGSAGISKDGSVFAVGGIEEKILAAHSAGKKTFIIAQDQHIQNADKLPTDIEIVRVATARELVDRLVV